MIEKSVGKKFFLGKGSEFLVFGLLFSSGLELEIFVDFYKYVDVLDLMVEFLI